MTNGLTRRETALTLAAGTLCGFSFFGFRAQAADSEAVAETRWGKVRGVRENGVYSFKGLRYAAPTGGDNRFMPPREPEPWSGIADASSFGARAPQRNPNPPSGPSSIILAHLPRPENAPPPGPAPVESEDCLFLNVWTSALNDGRKRPVMVWLHGGFFRGGSGDGVDGSSLAAQGDTVVISVNHRLNIFGYTHLGDLAGEAFARSGNVGMLDIVAALKWVRENAEAFGGDPDRVMVFGASGGGMKTAFLMSSPVARGLIHRGGVQSGPGLRMMDRDAASEVSERVLREFGLKASQAGDLQRVETERLLAAFHKVSADVGEGRYIDLTSFAPVIDPEVLPHHPFDPVAAPLAKEVPMLIGWNREEMTFFMGADQEVFSLDEAGLRSRLEGFLGDKADEALGLYRELHPELDPSGLYVRIFSDWSIMVPTMRQVQRHAEGGAGTYLYRFDWQSPAMDGRLGALHNLEQTFVFDTLDPASPLTGAPPEARALAGRMSSAWRSFAASADPNTDATPRWEQFSEDSRATMIFDTQTRLVQDPVAAEYDLLNDTV